MTVWNFWFLKHVRLEGEGATLKSVSYLKRKGEGGLKVDKFKPTFSLNMTPDWWRVQFWHFKILARLEKKHLAPLNIPATNAVPPTVPENSSYSQNIRGVAGNGVRYLPQMVWGSENFPFRCVNRATISAGIYWRSNVVFWLIFQQNVAGTLAFLNLECISYDLFPLPTHLTRPKPIGMSHRRLTNLTQTHSQSPQYLLLSSRFNRSSESSTINILLFT